MVAAGFTDVGQTRKHNQDSIYVSTGRVGPLPNLFIVADGMGGHNAGDVASKRAIEVVCAYLQSSGQTSLTEPDEYLDLLVGAAEHANDEIYNEGSESFDKRGMGTTLTLCVVNGGFILVVHVGDSRAYKITSDSNIEQITTDHTYVEELLAANRISPEQARTHPRRHVVTKVLGTRGPCQADGMAVPAEGISAVLLCSDGLSNMLDNDAIKDIMTNPSQVPARALCLISEANAKGGHDNISAIIIDLNEVS